VSGWLLIGGTGLLGREVLGLEPAIEAPPRSALDVTRPRSVDAAFERLLPRVVLHFAAATRPLEHEHDSDPGLAVNIIGTANVARACVRIGARLVYTSTDYVYAGRGPHREDEPVWPPYKFGWSKLAGECAVRLVQNHLILRLAAHDSRAACAANQARDRLDAAALMGA
jgi:dTDP-4-dehydrorhamnose reductase